MNTVQITRVLSLQNYKSETVNLIVDKIWCSPCQYRIQVSFTLASLAQSLAQLYQVSNHTRTTEEGKNGSTGAVARASPS